MQRQEAAGGAAVLGPAGEGSVGAVLEEGAMSKNCLPFTLCFLVNRNVIARKMHQYT